jgi:hypothetical protein
MFSATLYLKKRGKSALMPHFLEVVVLWVDVVEKQSLLASAFVSVPSVHYLLKFTIAKK